MRFRRTVLALLAFVIGALSDLLLIRNGLSLGGLTVLDTYPALWPAWLAAVLMSSLLLEFWYSRGGYADAVGPARKSAGASGLQIPLAMLLGGSSRTLPC